MDNYQIQYLFDYFGIDYIEDGDPAIRELNVPWSVNNRLAICCPYCDSDERFFMGIDEGGKHGCFYCGSGGYGKSIPWLVAKAAAVNVSEVFDAKPPERYLPAVKTLHEPVRIPEMEEFGKFVNTSAVSQKYIQYLVGRGVPSELMTRYLSYYKIMRGIGDFRNRVLFPIYRDGEIRTFVGRAIDGNKVRYRNADTALGFEKTSHNLLNFDSLRGGRLLVICEGILDVHLLPFCGVDGTSLLGKTVSSLQVMWLRKISRSYDRVIIVLDREVPDVDKMTMTRKLGFPCYDLPGKYGDLGEVPFEELKEWVRAILGL